jgi:hypothetical protein
MPFYHGGRRMSAETDLLLERHRPLLKYDSHESYFADSAAEWTDWKANRLRQGDRILAEATPHDGTPKLSLDFLGPDTYGNGEKVKKTDLIGDSEKDYAEASRELHQDPIYRNRMYGRAIADPAGRLWLQYWFFYFYNDFNLIGGFFGAGRHEGDWEMIQLRLTEKGGPDYAVYAQHKEAGVRRWDQVDVVPGTERPIVYVARGSHASYFEPGKHPLEVAYDWADGKRRSPEVKLEIVREDEPEWRWILWPGQWGDTEKPKPVSLPFDSDSPTGPCRHGQWEDPRKLAPDLPAEAATVRRVAEAPSPVALSKAEARREGDRLLIEYEVRTAEGRALRGLVVTVNSPDDEAPPATRAIEADRLAGSAEWPRPIDPAKHYDVHVSAAFDDHLTTASVRSEVEPAL